MRRDFIAGPNFSGRSAALRARLAERAGASFFVGPYAEAALSGLSNTVADEIEIYRAAPGEQDRPAFVSIDLASFAARKPATLSGGEQVLLALHAFSLSAYDSIGIDTALEQLDVENRAAALAYLSSGRFDVTLIDNRLAEINDWQRTNTTPTGDFACDLEGLAAELTPHKALVIAIRGMDFSYGATEIFRNADLSLRPGRAYRLMGPNGAGKTTLLKLLVGVLAPGRGTILLDDAPYDPRQHGNRAFALATQNPDHQWCGATLGEDMARRRKALATHGIAAPSDEAVASLAAKLGARDLDRHLYELPLAARKRLSWLWPLAGAMPWIMLDEPTVGQDRSTREGLAAIIVRLCEIGYGVVLVTHDDDFAGLIRHQPLRIADRTIKEE